MRNLGIAVVILLAGCSNGGSRGGEDRRHDVPSAKVETPSSQVAAERSAAPAASTAPAPTPAALPVTASATTAPPPSAAPAAGASTLEVVDATFTHGVERRAPIDRVSELRVGERVTYLVVIKNPGPATDIALEWVRDGRVVGRQSLEVGTSRAWRTWALRSVVGRDAATGIDVRVVDADGNVIHADHARVTPTSVPTA
ncbi:MAG: DUF2914 domain-containing protein [Deltaproteobacteria bacterium]|nr:DUF2914 domain-containing protein [Deltaproteobacteria bacterium]